MYRLWFDVLESMYSAFTSVTFRCGIKTIANILLSKSVGFLLHACKFLIDPHMCAAIERQ